MIARNTSLIIWLEKLVVYQYCTCIPTYTTLSILEPVSGFQQCYRDDVIDRHNLRHTDKWNIENSLRYIQFHGQDRAVIDGVLRGHLALDQLPVKKSRVVRVYVASTESGTKE